MSGNISLGYTMERFFRSKKYIQRIRIAKLMRSQISVMKGTEEHAPKTLKTGISWYFFEKFDSVPETNAKKGH